MSAIKAPALSMSVTPDGAVQAGQPATFQAQISNAESGDPTNVTITAQQTYPAGVTPVSTSGDGWNCAIQGQTVTCDRPGAGDDSLPPASSYPPIRVAADISADAQGEAVISATVGATDGADAVSSESRFTITPAQGAPS
ncbi:hypothetical protein ACFVWP_32655 [Streptomyces sp. NPDC058175]|uniref:hypothetical protein n=1 Tax=Streptomyces sp. NPDC058175 TaxID=3346367 RepID=UPI0036E27958